MTTWPGSCVSVPAWTSSICLQIFTKVKLWETTGNKKFWDKSLFFFFLFRGQKLRCVIYWLSNCFSPVMLGFWSSQFTTFGIIHSHSAGILLQCFPYLQMWHTVLLCMCLMYVCTKEESMCKGTRIHPCRHISNDEKLGQNPRCFLGKNSQRLGKCCWSRPKQNCKNEDFTRAVLKINITTLKPFFQLSPYNYESSGNRASLKWKKDKRMGDEHASPAVCMSIPKVGAEWRLSTVQNQMKYSA